MSEFKMDCGCHWCPSCWSHGGTTYSHLANFDMDMEDVHTLRSSRMSKTTKNFMIAFVITGLIVVATVALALLLKCEKESSTPLPTEEASTSSQGRSHAGQYRYAAVATDTDICSKIGTDVLGHLGGSAVDAAVAAMFCVGVVNMHSTGVGGGHFMTVYDVPRGESAKVMTTFLSREVAPGTSGRDMFINKPNASTMGGLAVGVPGEVAGLYAAWQKFGRVDWSKLVEPSIHLCQEGIPVGHSLASAVAKHARTLKADSNLLEILAKADGSLISEGDRVKLPKLARTLQQIAGDPMSFYSGSLAEDIVQDLAELGSIISKEDLMNYQTREKTPLNVTLQNGRYTVFAPRPPSSGAVLMYILNILDGYNFGPFSKDSSNIARTYQRIVEAFKFAFADRSALGDEDFVDVSKLLVNLTSESYAETTRVKLNETHTQKLLYYGPMFEIVQDNGTSHLSIVAPDGSAVSMTGTINLEFGARICGSRTGIIFNNEMDDFSTPGTVNTYGVPSSSSNYIEPGKMPMSSMSPTLILDQEGKVVFVVGAAGGTHIISATAQVIINSLWFGKSVQAAIDTARVHHQLLPNVITVEPQIDKDLLAALQSYGHKTNLVTTLHAVVQAIHNLCGNCTDNSCFGESCIQAACDARKGGKPDGF